jgi:hypothetical protein
MLGGLLDMTAGVAWKLDTCGSIWLVTPGAAELLDVPVEETSVIIPFWMVASTIAVMTNAPPMTKHGNRRAFPMVGIAVLAKLNPPPSRPARSRTPPTEARTTDNCTIGIPPVIGQPCWTAGRLSRG